MMYQFIEFRLLLHAKYVCCLMMLAKHVICAQEEIRAQQKQVEAAAQAEAEAAAAAATAKAAQEEVLDRSHYLVP